MFAQGNLFFRSSYEEISNFPVSLSVYYNQLVFILEGVGVFAAYLFLNHQDIIAEKMYSYKTSIFNVFKLQKTRSDVLKLTNKSALKNITLIGRPQEVALDVSNLKR